MKKKFHHSRHTQTREIFEKVLHADGFYEDPTVPPPGPLMAEVAKLVNTVILLANEDGAFSPDTLEITGEEAYRRKTVDRIRNGLRGKKCLMQLREMLNYPQYYDFATVTEEDVGDMRYFFRVLT